MKKWKAPNENGIQILTMPNIPHPLHGLAPRTIMGASRWKLTKTKEKMRADYHCEICGREFSINKLDVHEIYDVFYDERYSKFNRYVCACALCHQACHSGRNLALYTKGDKYTTKEYMLELAERTFRLVNQWNMQNIEKEPLKLCDTWLTWAKHPDLKEDIENYIDRYEIEFYKQPTDSWNEDNWDKWYLQYNGKKYPTLYKTIEEWKEKYV